MVQRLATDMLLLYHVKGYHDLQNVKKKYLNKVIWTFSEMGNFEYYYCFAYITVIGGMKVLWKILMCIRLIYILDSLFLYVLVAAPLVSIGFIFKMAGRC